MSTTWMLAGLHSARSLVNGWLASALWCRTFAPGVAQLAFTHVSSPVRATGIGRRLSDELDRIARAAGDSEMVMTATPSENTVRFYLGRGFRPMAEPLAELFELEPEDIHMSKMV